MKGDGFMAFYNKSVKYNFKKTNGGGMYNSAPFIVVVYDAGAGNDIISSLLANIYASDSGTGSESVLATVTLSPISDAGSGQENVSLTADVGVSDTGIGNEALSLTCQIAITDAGIGQEIVGTAKTFFIIDSDNILQPLGVLVLQDSRQELLPSTRDNTEEIPGRHGEIDFGTEFKARILELHVATPEGLSPIEKSQLQRLFAKYLDPTKGAKPLVFSDDLEKTYIVKYAGKIDITQYPTWFEFTIPFKMSDPFIIGSFEKVQIGSGTLTNNGTFETPVVIEITGPVTNPSVVVGDQTLTYTGTVPSGQKLIIDTSNQTVKLNGVNALANYNGVFPMLQPGDTSVTAASAGTTVFKWRDRWL